MKEILWNAVNDAIALLHEELLILAKREDLNAETKHEIRLRKNAALDALGALKCALD